MHIVLPRTHLIVASPIEHRRLSRLVRCTVSWAYRTTGRVMLLALLQSHATRNAIKTRARRRETGLRDKDRKHHERPQAESDLRCRARAPLEGHAREDGASAGIDALLMQNNNDWLGGYVKWFTDFPAYNGYPRTVIFHADDAMTVVDMGPAGVTAQLRRPAQDPSRRRRTAHHAGLHLDRLYRRLSGRTRARRIEAARLSPHRHARTRRHAASLRGADRAGPRRQDRDRRCDRMSRRASRRSRARRK